MTDLPMTPTPSEIAARLRARGTILYTSAGEASDLPELAADAIDELAADNARLRAALEDIQMDAFSPVAASAMVDPVYTARIFIETVQRLGLKARAALKEGSQL